MFAVTVSRLIQGHNELTVRQTCRKFRKLTSMGIEILKTVSQPLYVLVASYLDSRNNRQLTDTHLYYNMM